MKSLIICHDGLRTEMDGHYEAITLGHYPLTLGLANTGNIRFERKRTHKDSVLVEKQAFAVNYRDRAWIMTNHARAGSRDELFYFGICSEFVGVVTKAGANVTSLVPGDRVIPVATYPSDIPGVPDGIPTNYASRRLEVFHGGQLMKIPDALADEQAAGFTIGAQTAYGILRRLSISPGQNILVTAATSNTSLFVLELLRHLPVNIYTLSTRKDCGKILAAMGLPVKKNYTHTNEMRTLSHGFDVIIDPFADIYMSGVLAYASMNAQYITCGIQWQPAPGMPAGIPPGNVNMTFFSNLIGKNITVSGNCLGNRADLQQAMADATENRLHVHIDSVHMGDQIKSFFNRGFNDPQKLGKVVYKYTD